MEHIPPLEDTLVLLQDKLKMDKREFRRWMSKQIMHMNFQKGMDLELAYLKLHEFPARNMETQSTDTDRHHHTETNRC